MGFIAKTETKSFVTVIVSWKPFDKINHKVPTALFLESFNEKIRLKRFWSCRKSGKRIPGINPQVFPASIWE